MEQFEEIDEINEKEPLDQNLKMILGGTAAILILGAIAIFFLFLQQPGFGTLTVTVENPEGNPLWKATVKATGVEETHIDTTNIDGEAIFQELAMGETFEIEASGKGFKTKKTSITISNAEEILTINLEPEIENRADFKTINFVGPEGTKLEGKLITVELSCSTGMLLEEPIKQVSTGSLGVEVPSGCGTMMAKVLATGYQTNSYNLDETSIIRLEANEVETNSKLTVIVKDPQGNPLNDIEVTITDLFDAPIGEVENTSFGQAKFDLAPGTYKVKIFDSSLEYDSVEEEVSIAPGDHKKKTITLSKETTGTIKVKVVDKKSKAEISNSIIVFEKPNGEKISQEFIEEYFEFPIGEEGTYKISAGAEGYLPSEPREVDSAEFDGKTITISLEPCTPSTCGVLKINVVDEDGIAVPNARVAITDPETGFFIDEYGTKYSDVKGQVEFRNIKEGTYTALAQKYPSEGVSEPFEVVEGKDNEITLEMFVGEGTIIVEALDIDKRPIPFGTAEFLLESGESLGILPLDVEGRGTLTTKADKKIFVIVEAEGYTSYTSKAIQIYPEEKTTITAELKKEILGDKPEIEFIGVFDLGDGKVNHLTAGNSFRAKFRVIVPVENEYEQLGVFIRTGNYEKAEKDDIVITSINAPRASVIKGRTYNEPIGTEEDFENLTNGDAKWALTLWDSGEIRQGIYEFEAEIRVKESTTPGKFLPLYYRVFAINNNQEVLRSPYDAELGTGEETGSKHALYAESFEKTFFEGGLKECDEDFCYSERMLDVKEDIFIEEDFDLKIFSTYEYEFEITNNSETIHDNAEIRIKNSLGGIFTEEKLKIKDYEIMNSDSQEFSSGNDTFEIEAITLGDFRRNKTITGKLTLKPEEIGRTGIHIRIVSDQLIVFEKIVNINVVKEKELEVTVLPETLPAFTEFDLNISVVLSRGDEEFEEVKDAMVKVERTTMDREKTIFVTTTNGMGEAWVTIPASGPGTRIKIKIEKEGYAAETIRMQITDDIFTFNPERLTSTLDLTSNNDEKLDLEATNLVPIPLHLTKLWFNGNFLGLMDTLKMNNYLEQYVDRTQFQDLIPVKLRLLTAISEDAMLLEEVMELRGELIMEVANEDESIKWPFRIPINIMINLSEPPKHEGCIEISMKEWDDVTLGGKAEVEFSIQNNCITQNNRPLDLRKLKAKVDWKSNKFGNIELHILDPETGQDATNVLIEGIYSEFFDKVDGGKEYIGLLVFTPKGGTRGETAEFDVIFNAGQITNAGEQLVGASNDIQSEINIIDLSECIVITPDPEAGLILQPTQDEGVITFDSSSCGNIDIDFWLCKDDKGCSGGVDGEIRVSPEKFSMTKNNSTKTISVSRQEIPGMYGITVFVKTPGSLYREIKTIDVLAKPTPEDAFELSKYDFMVKGEGATDSAELTNKFFFEEVTVTASVCDWGTAEEKGWFDMKGAGMGGMTGALAGLTSLIGGIGKAANTVSTTTTTVLNKTKEAQKAATEADEMTSEQLRTECNKIVGEAQTSVSRAERACFYVVEGSGTALIADGYVKAAIGQCEAAATQLETINEMNRAREETINKAIEYHALAGAGYSFDETETGQKLTEALATKAAEQTAVTAELEGGVLELVGADSALAGGATTVASTCTLKEIFSGGSDPCPGCISALGDGAAEIGITTGELEAFITKQIGTSVAKEAATKTAVEVFGAATETASKKIVTAATQSTGSGWGRFAGMMGAETVGGFLIGGLAGGLFGPDPCDQMYTADLPDYIINILTDSFGIESENDDFLFAYDRQSARIVGSYEEQRIGVIVTNLGVEDEKPVYSTATFNVIQHLHINPTEPRNDDFGPFNVPDQRTQRLESKIHLKFKTAETVETIPELSFDTLACTSGNKIGRTGDGAVPKIKLDWSFSDNSIAIDECLEQNPDGIYCDATQFSIMLSKKLKNLKEFFEINPILDCPENPLLPMAEDMAAPFDIDVTEFLGEECYLPTTEGMLDGRPAIMMMIEATSLNGTPEIPDSIALENEIKFNALLKKDGYTEDFMTDFARHYADERFFDTPDWFYGMATDEYGGSYGIDKLFKEGRITVTNRFFESEQLSSAGVYDVLINIRSDDGTYNFFNEYGEPNVWIELQVQLLQEPNPNSAFYSVPFDGLVGLEGDSFNRQGYGVTFENKNTEEFVIINNDTQPLRTYNDAGSNPVSVVYSDVERSFYSLNTSPSERGNLFSLEKESSGDTTMKFSPSKATPVMLRVNAEHITQDELSVFYVAATGETPIEAGSVLTYWSGAGACLDPKGILITESFDERPDRAALPSDPITDWKTSYGVDFGNVIYTGDSYLRTVFYTNPLDRIKLIGQFPKEQMHFFTPDNNGKEINLDGVSGVEFNGPEGGTTGSVNTVVDVFNLVKEERVCVIDTGRKATFFWNPKSVYELEGKERNISEFTNSLTAGDTCIGLGG